MTWESFQLSDQLVEDLRKVQKAVQEGDVELIAGLLITYAAREKAASIRASRRFEDPK